MFRLFICFLLICPLCSFAQNASSGRVYNHNGEGAFVARRQVLSADSDVAKTITDKLKAYFTGHIAEQTYLHFDKPYYAAGDTIYFKAYVTGGESHLLSDISGVLHVDLMGPANEVIRPIRLQLKGGIGWGDFALPDTLPKGNYRVRAYTKWMLNGGLTNYFDKVIPVGSLHADRIPESSTAQPRMASIADVQFFPEGGELVTGLTSKVAFKAIGSDGLGINIKGQVLDNQNAVVTTFASTHLGMGSFDLSPDEGKTYKAKITYPDGSVSMRDMPLANAKGLVLTVDNDSSARALLNIMVNDDYFKDNRNKNYALVIYSGGEASAYNFKISHRLIKFNLSKKTLHTGIASITLFSPDGEPLSQRLIFVQNNDQLGISTSSSKPVYAKRESVNLKFDIKDKAAATASGHFSVSVTDEGLVPVDENKESTILTNTLLSNDLKGYVEQPNYYFLNTSDKTTGNLDLVMLTHGYHRFEWKQVLGNTPPFTAYQPEKALDINGIVKLSNGQPLAKGTVSLLSVEGGSMLTAEVAEDGNFSFHNVALMDSTRFFLKALNTPNARIAINASQPIALMADDNLLAEQGDANKVQPQYLENKKAQLDEKVNYSAFKALPLKQVDIKDKNYASSKIGGAGNADQVIREGDNKISGGAFSTRYNLRLHGVKFVGGEGNKNPYLIQTRSPKTPHPMLLVLDGSTITLDESDNGISLDALVNVSDIETIEVLSSAFNETLYGVRGGEGVLVITTRRGIDKPGKIAPGVVPVPLSGFYKAREFYSPKYDVTNTAIHKDLRPAIYWNPELVTDKDGNASVSYFNADGPGTYRVVIEGIDDKGNLGRQVYRYKVQ